MISDSSSNCRGLAVAFAVVLGVGIAGSQSSALARDGNAVPHSLAGVTAPAPLVGQRGSTPTGAIVVADNQWDNDNGHKNGKGKKNGDNDHNGNSNNNGENKNWSGNGQNWKGNNNKNWKGNGQNWSGNNKNWNKNGQNWNGDNDHNHNGNWNKNGGKNWSNNNHWNNHWNDDWNGRAYVRGWQPRPYYGDFFGGVVLGSLLAAAGVGVVPYSPDPNLCWYWADPYMYRGYWDYCY